MPTVSQTRQLAVTGHLPARLEPGKLDQSQPRSSTERSATHPVTLRQQQARGMPRQPTRETLHTADSVRSLAGPSMSGAARRSPGSGVLGQSS